MEIRQTSLLFPETSGEGPQEASVKLQFPREVIRVTAGVTGYSASFEDDEDHHVGRLELEISARVDESDSTVVNVGGRFGLRDWSNNWDDPYSCIVEVAVLAELVAVPTPGPGDPRLDVVIVGVEQTQAIQHFRSADHLSAPNVFPDNSIRLVESKPTVLRLYADYDATSGLALISQLSGELVVRSGASMTTIAPIQPIAPRRDVSTNRGIRTHTLNFIIPDTLCRGIVDLEARIFDANDSTQFSPLFQRTVEFASQPMLPVLAVGINYTGPDTKDGALPAELAAPVEADFVNTLEFTDRTYPIPGITITDYREMEYDEEVTSDINEGCDKMGDLKDALADFVGDSDDVVFGLYNVGVDTGTVGGCGGGGVSVGKIDRGPTAAHEIGHALGRQHAPCDNVTRCATPRNTDDSYPVYSGYDSDSIGEFGFDPVTTGESLKTPSVHHDFMGYSNSEWVSPYNYKALMSAIPGSTITSPSLMSLRGAPDRPPDETGNEWVRVKQPKLFLAIDVSAAGARLRPSFHYDALPRRVNGRESDYVIEFADEDGNVLRRTCLQTFDPSCGCGSPTTDARIRQAVAFDPRARSMTLRHREAEVATWRIPAPPTVDVTCERRQGDVIRLRWRITAPDDTDRDQLWSLVQWQDRLGTWRGVAPRTQKRQLDVPAHPSRPAMTYRVLVTSGIATGVGYLKDDCSEQARTTDRRRPRIVAPHMAEAEGSHELPRIVSASVLGMAGDSAGHIRWYGSDGGELGRGRRLDLTALPIGQNVVTVAVVGATSRVPQKSWLIQRTEDGRFLLHVGEVARSGTPALRPDQSQEEPRRAHKHVDGRAVQNEPRSRRKDK